ncbi:TetR/AcrR family transcriptional regulator [Pengzhenrongella frigida]|uniref:TetR/AcrR family transcriptional regulator n=1 Tax=Pengzhenrongella frigida TaxID=1259133 RepID=A0A4Q5MXR4_9MICO|nr:TetR/AcrR family transcriptional regulator [Cellulomonas sp. HLT2-17]RYV50532.1 TetR/AcrR family transcriptional regulator [Cellulomonas sp. HLT2-17]
MDLEPATATVKAAPATPERQATPERRGDTRQQIMAAAIALISDQGFSATSVEEIAAAAGVAKGSVYYNFGSKEELFTTILTEGVTRLSTALRAASAGLEGQRALEALITELLTQVHEHPDFAKLITAEIFRTGRHWQESVRLVRDDSMGAFADVVHRSRPDLDAKLVGAAVFGATLVAGLEWLVFSPERTFAELRAAVLVTTGGMLAA